MHEMQSFLSFVEGQEPKASIFECIPLWGRGAGRLTFSGYVPVEIYLHRGVLHLFYTVTTQPSTFTVNRKLDLALRSIRLRALAGWMRGKDAGDIRRSVVEANWVRISFCVRRTSMPRRTIESELLRMSSRDKTMF